ncbi:MAG TPA: TonB-dependent receptor plug domain-containing protein, partial [Bacteroidia bacterium]|nr:TonB-dependent receptor plug domain-containing protein [Bacteroidia bacterium]
MLLFQYGKAQDTTLLQTVNVTALKSLDFSAGKRTDQIDSSTKQNFTFHSLADLLQLNSGIFIKNYGPGALAGTSMRGGNASQTAILWNGINIQNAMLGQNDLSLLPSVMFNDMKVEYGGSSALWGSGAVAGSILLGNKADFNKGFETKVNVSKASFGTFKTSAVLNYSNRKIFSSTKVYLHNSNNDFTYVKNANGRDSLYRQKNSVFSIKGFMQQVKFLLDPFQSLEFNFWADQAERQLALNTDVNFKPAVQKDENIRAQLSWNKNKNKWNQTWKTALLSNAIIYNNENAGTHDFSRVLSAILENENIYRYSAKSQMILGMNSNISEAISDAYLKKQSIYKVSVLAGNRSLLFNDKMEINTVLRGEYFSTTALPFTGNIGISYAPLKGLKVGVNAAKIYRQPTLNELY